MLDVSQAVLYGLLIWAVYDWIEQQLVLDNAEYSMHHALAGYPAALVNLLQLSMFMQLLKLIKTLVKCSVDQCPYEFLK